MPAQGNTWATGTPGQGIIEGSQTPLMGQPNYVWDPGMLAWVKMVQPGGGGGGSVTQGTVPWITDQQLKTYVPVSGTISANGDNVVITPAAGKTVRVYYLSFGADQNNSTQVIVRLRPSSLALGSSWYTYPLVPGAVIARNVGAGKFYVAGGVNDTIIVNLSGSLTVYWTLETDQI